MKMLRLSSIGLVTALGLAAVATGCATTGTPAAQAPFVQERVHPVARVKMIVPNGWNVGESADGSLVMTEPSSGLSILVKVVDGNDLATALLAVGTGILIGTDEVGLDGTPVDANINGMSALFQDGHAKVNGQAVSLSVGVIDTPADKYLLVVGEGTPTAVAANEAQLRSFFNSLSPL